MKLKYIALLLLITCVSACSKVNDAPVADFDVKTSTLEYKAGDEVTFSFTGNPFQITFYSGEKGKEYQYRITPGPGSDMVDYATPIKAYQDVHLDNFTYIYPTAGTYTATFVASSTSAYSSEELVKSITLIIH